MVVSKSGGSKDVLPQRAARQSLCLVKTPRRKSAQAALVGNQMDQAGLEGGQSEDMPIGSPCVVDDYCKLCRRQARMGQWGNAKCRGCSIVDLLPFKWHPFYRLLMDYDPHVKLKVPKPEWPKEVERCELVPPPLRPSDELRYQRALGEYRPL